MHIVSCAHTPYADDRLTYCASRCRSAQLRARKVMCSGLAKPKAGTSCTVSGGHKFWGTLVQTLRSRASAKALHCATPQRVVLRGGKVICDPAFLFARIRRLGYLLVRRKPVRLLSVRNFSYQHSHVEDLEPVEGSAPKPLHHRASRRRGGFLRPPDRGRPHCRHLSLGAYDFDDPFFRRWVQVNVASASGGAPPALSGTHEPGIRPLADDDEKAER